MTHLLVVRDRVPAQAILLVSPQWALFQREGEADPQVVAAVLRAHRMVAREAVPRVDFPRAVRAEVRAGQVMEVPRVAPLVGVAVVAHQTIQVEVEETLLLPVPRTKQIGFTRLWENMLKSRMTFCQSLPPKETAPILL